MYRRAKFVELLLEIRQEMALEADYDVDLFAEIARSGGTSVQPNVRKKLFEARSDITDESQADTVRLAKDTAAT